MACPKCGNDISPNELRGLGLVVIERDPKIAPGGNVLPIQVFFCACGRLEMFLADSRTVVDGEDVGPDVPKITKG